MDESSQEQGDHLEGDSTAQVMDGKGLNNGGSDRVTVSDSEGS